MIVSSIQYCIYTIFVLLVFINTAFSADKYQTDISKIESQKLSDATKLRRIGQLDEANSILTDLVANNSSYYQAYYNLGLTYAKKKKYIESEKYLKRASVIREKLKINDNRIYNALGWVLFSQYKYEEAESVYLKGLDEKYNNNAANKRIYTNLGTLYYVTGDLPNATIYLSTSANKYGSKEAMNLLDQISTLEENQIQKVVSRKIKLSISEGEYIGQKVWLNESGGKQDSLISWNAGENHASVGIGHFIWYPKNQEGPFQESFPELLKFLLNNDVKLPQWLHVEKTCPWDSRSIMLRVKQDKDEKYLQLELLLRETIPFQVEFMIQRLNGALPLMLDTVNAQSERDNISKQFYKVSHRSDGAISSDGVYALLDYVNFKGEGTNKKERYKDQGWGLLQVLNGMDTHTDEPLVEFIESAKRTLERRIKNSPPDRNEGKWRNGWFKRLSTYQS